MRHAYYYRHASLPSHREATAQCAARTSLLTDGMATKTERSDLRVISLKVRLSNMDEGVDE